MNEERREALTLLLNDGGRRVEEFFNSAPGADLDLEDAVDDARFEAAIRFDPKLASLRNSTYLVRLRADDGNDSDIVGGSLREIMAGFEAELAAAAPKAKGQVQLALDNVTRGSVLLHYRAIRPLAVVNDDQFDQGLSEVDAAIGRVSALHKALESGDAYTKIAKVAGSKDLLKASRDLMFAMDKHGLTATTRWRNAQGQRVDSTLSLRARETAKAVFEAGPESENISISGRVNSLALDGRFSIKVRVGRGRTYDIKGDPEIVRTKFQLGATVHLVVAQEIQKDRVGLETVPKFTLVSINPPLVL